MMRVCWSCWQAPNVAVFVCSSEFCGATSVPATAVATEADRLATEATMCAAMRQTLATQLGLPLDAVTLTKCVLTVLPARRRLAEPGRKQLERSLQTVNTLLCVRATGPLLVPCPRALAVWVQRAEAYVVCVSR
jgi:hypothetical protein